MKFCFHIAGKCTKRFAAALVIFGVVAPSLVSAQTVPTETTLVLKPHCILQERKSCGQYVVADAEHLRTPPVNAGYILDIDVVLKTSKPDGIRTVRSWLKYDPAVLEARSIELNGKNFPQAIPGESTIDSNAGIIKIGAGTTGLTDEESVVARITLRVRDAKASTTLSFVDYRADGTGTTSVLGDDDGTQKELLKGEPSKLTVSILSADGNVVQAASVSNAQVDNNTTTRADLAGSTFSMLQVQNLRVTTRENNIFAGWQSLPSTQLAGYNVYYGTVSGKYMQRRSIPANSNSIVIRDLESGTQYYLAVRAFNDKSEETVFSHEVGVKVGKPETSTAPLSEATVSEPILGQQGNPIELNGGSTVTGETGVGDWLFMLIIASAGIGTILAWRRQMKILPDINNV